MSRNHRRRVAVVTGGGRGIGAAIAEELGRAGAFVVTVDPLVSVEGGVDPDATAEPTTAERIVAAGGAARASEASVTDRAALDELFAGLVEEFGTLDAVVNAAGISRPTGFATGDEAAWRDVLAVHLDGYRNVLGAALPLMAAAGHGRVLGVTSGSGWRAADAGAYSCAKRAVAALTWQVGPHAPPGVTVNALSPIALTRMVTSALTGPAGPVGSSVSGNLALGAGMPSPDQIGPLGAHLAGEGLEWCTGQVVFGSGAEVAVIEPPRLLEVVRADRATSLATVLDEVGVGALIPAEQRQATTGGSNPRFGAIFDDVRRAATIGESVCGVVVGDPARAAAVRSALEARGGRCVVLDPRAVAADFAGAATAMATLAERGGALDAVVVDLAGSTTTGSGTGWERVLAEHDGLAERLLADAGWARAAADHAARAERPLRLVTLADGATTGGRSRAQAAAQLSRAALGATDGRVAAFAITIETASDPTLVGEAAAHLACHPEATPLSGAELVAGPGWFGLRSHPRPVASVIYGGPALPPWLDATIRAIVTGAGPEESG